MLVARDPLTNTFVNAFDYKHMSPEERPNGLLCPGVCFDGTPCTAPVTPAALSSEHKHPYFRVGRIDNHIDGCTEGATRVDSPEAAIHTDEHKGRSHPRALISLCTSHFDAPRVRQLGQFREARTPLIRLSVIADPHQHRLETGHSPSSVGCAKPSWTTHAASLMTMTP